jgi:outer membrane protein
MKALFLSVLALVVAGSSAAALAQSAPESGFYGAVGYSSVAPKSHNGVLAGAFHSSINDDSEPTLTLGYRFTPNWGAEAWLPLAKFKHGVKLEGMKSASIEHMPVLLTAQYHFLADQAWQPFIGVGYGWVSVSDEHTTGPIAGTSLNVKSSDGAVGQLGLDYLATPNLFLRADARYFDWSSKVQLNGAGIGTVKVDPWIYGVSVGYRF